MKRSQNKTLVRTAFRDMNRPDDVSPQQRLDIAKLLVEKATDVDARWGAGVDPQSAAARMIDTTPLMLASSKGETEMVRFLLMQSVDVMAANASGQTAIHFATGSPTASRDVVDSLLKSKAEFNALTRDGKTSLDLAQDAGVKILLIQNGGKKSSELRERAGATTR
jgi:ankyrin repeat protein